MRAASKGKSGGLTKTFAPGMEAMNSLAASADVAGGNTGEGEVDFPAPPKDPPKKPAS